jgi:hypothetical protein
MSDIILLRMNINHFHFNLLFQNKFLISNFLIQTNCLGIGVISVADPDPNSDPTDPHIFGPPGSGSISQRYGSGSGSGFGSGSGSFYHHAKIIRKTLISLTLFDFLSLKN